MFGENPPDKLLLSLAARVRWVPARFRALVGWIWFILSWSHFEIDKIEDKLSTIGFINETGVSGISMNVHHLELFYHVARCGGITAAARSMPYPIQQPAISSQLIALEQELGVTLFRRRPFSLTRAGENLWRFVEPFFRRLSDIASEIREEASTHLRIAAFGTVLQDYLPPLLDRLRGRVPSLRLTLSDTNASESFALLERNEVDLVFSVLVGPMPKSLPGEELLDLRVGLIVPESWGWSSWADVVKEARGSQGRIRRPLITLPPDEIPSAIFQQELAKRGLIWSSNIVVATYQTLLTYVRMGFGCGMHLEAPGYPIGAGLKFLPVTGMVPLHLVAAYGNPPTPLALEMVVEARVRAAALRDTTLE